jgi:hypothetical protein
MSLNHLYIKLAVLIYPSGLIIYISTKTAHCCLRMQNRGVCWQNIHMD